MSKRILVVDDDPDIRQVLVDRLRSYGYAVVAVNDGVEALTFLRRDAFDGMLLDIEMPKISGLEVLYHIRATSHPTMPVVMVTALTTRERVIQSVVGSTAQAYLPKPFDSTHLKTTVDRWFGPPS